MITARVTLTVVHGPLTGRTLVFTEPDTCLLGRDPDCHLVVPDDHDHRRVSRHQCRLEISPPAIRLHDLQSRNGTTVNNRLVSIRAETPAGQVPGTLDLRDGDEIHLGTTVLRVGITSPAESPPTELQDEGNRPAICDRCWVEIPAGQRAASAAGDGVHICPACQGQRGRSVCQRCGVPVPPMPLRPSEILCPACLRGQSALPALPSPLPQVAGHAVLRELGKGGMGVVYLAREESSGREVALKVMLPSIAVHPRARDLFQREMQAIRRLDHPNIVRLIDTGCSGVTFYFTMEFCAGGSVRDLIKAGGPLSVAEAIDLTLQTLTGLDHAHNVRGGDGGTPVADAHGVVHRDLSPDNLFLTANDPERRCKIGDFGLATAVDRAGLSGSTRTGSMGGKPAYVCRQQVRGYRHARPEVDVWAVAACLYAMLTGCPPRDFPAGRDPWAIVLETSPVPVRQRRPDVPGPLADLLDRTLDDTAALRFGTAAELRQALATTSTSDLLV